MSKVHKLLNQINISGRIAVNLANNNALLFKRVKGVQLSVFWAIVQNGALFF